MQFLVMVVKQENIEGVIEIFRSFLVKIMEIFQEFIFLMISTAVRHVCNYLTGTTQMSIMEKRRRSQAKD